MASGRLREIKDIDRIMESDPLLLVTGDLRREERLALMIPGLAWPAKNALTYALAARDESRTRAARDFLRARMVELLGLLYPMELIMVSSVYENGEGMLPLFRKLKRGMM